MARLCFKKTKARVWGDGSGVRDISFAPWFDWGLKYDPQHHIALGAALG